MKRIQEIWNPAKQPQESSPSVAWLYLGNQFLQKRVNQILSAAQTALYDLEIVYKRRNSAMEVIPEKYYKFISQSNSRVF